MQKHRRTTEIAAKGAQLTPSENWAGSKTWMWGELGVEAHVDLEVFVPAADAQGDELPDDGVPQALGKHLSARDGGAAAIGGQWRSSTLPDPSVPAEIYQYNI